MKKAPFAPPDLRIAGLFICFLVLVPLLAACGSSGNGATTLVVWTVEANRLAKSGQEGVYAHYLVDQFQKEHPNVKVKLEDHGWDEELRQNLTTALLGGTAPDVVIGESFFRQFAALNALLPLENELGDLKNDVVPATYEGSMYQGHIYTLSAYTGVFGLERNCEVVKKAGFDCDKPPQTWDELLKQAQTITQKEQPNHYGYTLQGPAGFSIGAVLRLSVYLAQAGASLCKDDCSKPWFDNPKAVPVYEFIRKLNKTTPPGLTFNSDEGQLYMQLHKGKTAYQIGGSWHVAASKTNGCGDCRYSPVPIPQGGKNASVLVADVQYAALKQSKNPDLAKAFVRFIARDDTQLKAYEERQTLPTNKKALQKLRSQVDPATQQFIDTLLNSELHSLPQWTKNPQKVWSAYNDMLTKLLTTDAPVPQLLSDAQKAAEQAVQ